MVQSITDEKKRLRGESAVRRNLFSDDDVRVSSLEAITQSPWFQNAKTVSLYIAQPFEFPTKTIFELCMREGKTVYAPIIQGRQLTFQKLTHWGQFSVNEKNIHEPIFGSEMSADRIDLFFVPLVAFDRSGNRLGRGGGYFDRLFSDINIQGVKVGVGFDAQEFFAIPTEAHDVSMDYILTEKRIIKAL